MFVYIQFRLQSYENILKYASVFEIFLKNASEKCYLSRNRGVGARIYFAALALRLAIARWMS